MEIQRATREDQGEIAALLAAAGLPALPQGLPLANVLVARDEGELVGVMALEVASRRGIVCGAAVAEGRRGQGIGSSLLQSVVSRAHELGLKDLYLLSGEAHGFFGKSGFGPTKPEAVPDEIRRTREFRARGGGDVRVMRLALATRL